MKVSIITPSFNQAPFLTRTLESVVSQTHSEIEHIIQDAGSNDGSLEILNRYAEGKPHVRLTVEKDFGQADAINRGLRLATGEFLCWLNTDDYYESPDVIEAVARIFQKEPEVEVVYGRGDFVSASGEILRNAFIHADPEKLPHHLVRSVGILQPALFFRASLIHRAGLLDTEMSCAFDHELWTRFAAAGAKFHFLDRKLVNATFHQDAKSTRLRRTQILESAEVSKRYYSFASAEWITRSVEFDLTRRNQIFDQQNRPQPSEEQKALAEQISQARFRAANSSNAARFAIISAPDLTQYAATRRLAKASGLVETDRVIATTFDNAYFEQGLTLIRSIRAWGGVEVPVVVYDLDLSPEHKRHLAGLANVHLAPYPQDAVDSFPGFLHPKNYSYKCVAIHDAGRFVAEGGIVLWIDAGVAPIASLEPIYDIVRETGVFFVDHDDKADWPFYNGSFCHPRAAETLGASTSELFGEHLCSCLLGYRKGGPFQELFKEADRYARIEDAVIWSKHPSLSTTEEDTVPPKKSHSRLSQELAARPGVLKAMPPSQAAYVLGYFGHRQDQTIFSILAARHGAPIQSATRFCRSDDASSKVSKLNWASRSAWQGIESLAEVPPHMEGAVTYHHRGIYQRADVIPSDRPVTRELVILPSNAQNVYDLDLLAIVNRPDQVRAHPRYYVYLDGDLSQLEALEKEIRNRASSGVELFALREPIITALPDDLKKLSCIWNLDELRTLIPEMFSTELTAEGDAALIGAMLGYPQLVIPEGSISDAILTVLADLDVRIAPPMDAEPVVLDDYFRPVQFRVPQTTGINEAVKRLLPSEVLELKVETPTDLAKLCWERRITKLDLLRVKGAGLESFPWERLKPQVIEYLFQDAFQTFEEKISTPLQRQGYAIYLIKDPAKAGYRIHPNYETVVRKGEENHGEDWHAALAFQADPGIAAVRQAFLEKSSSPVSEEPPAGPAMELIPAQIREAARQVDELTLVHDLLDDVAAANKVLISVEANRATLRSPYLSTGWRVLAAVSDAAERSYLSGKYQKEIAHRQLILEGRIVSNKIDALTASAPLADMMQEHGILSAAVLHLDERDWEAVQGFPWHACSPSVVLSLVRMSERTKAFLRDRGYRILLSEWHPTLQRGVPPQWKSLKEISSDEFDGEGATIALRAGLSSSKLVGLLEAQLAPPRTELKEDSPQVIEETPIASPEVEEIPPQEKPAPSKSVPRELRAGTKAAFRSLFQKKKPLVLAGAFGIVGGAIALFLFSGAVAALLWLLAAVSLALNALAVHRQDQTEFALRSALGDVALLKDKVSDLRTRTKTLENRSASLEQKAADVELRARKLESLTASTKRTVDILDDRVGVGVKDLDERALSLQWQAEVDRRNIDSLSDSINLLRTLPAANPDLSQPRSRVLSELGIRSLEIWARRLGVEVTRSSLSYLAHRVAELETRSIGRLDLDLETAVLYLLILKSMAGRELRSLEVGGLFGIGLAMQFECCLGDFSSLHVSCAEPTYGHEFPEGRDPYTLQTISTRAIERNLLWAGAKMTEMRISETLLLEPSASYDLVLIHGVGAPLLAQVASAVRPGGYVLVTGESGQITQMELLGQDLGLTIFRVGSR